VNAFSGRRPHLSRMNTFGKVDITASDFSLRSCIYPDLWLLHLGLACSLWGPTTPRSWCAQSPKEKEGVMRRILVGIAVALGSIAAIAGPPTPPTVAVQVTNTPLPVTTPQATIPFDMFGNTGIKGHFCLLRRTTDSGTQFGETAICISDPAPALSSPGLIWEVLFMPTDAAYGLDDPYKAAGCRALYWLSVDNGTSFKRIAEASWSPGQFQSIVVPFPVPIELPAGSVVVQQLSVTMSGGKINNGCNVNVRALTSIK